MNEITCDVCVDLIPLVQDGVASEDSQRAVEHHVSTCECCAALYKGAIPSNANEQKVFMELKKKVQFFTVMLMMFGIFFGLGLTADSDIFYNSLIMPVIGALGYVVFRWKALYVVPLFILVANVLSNLMGLLRGSTEQDLYAIIMWAGIYSIFVVIGIIIAGLLHFALRRE